MEVLILLIFVSLVLVAGAVGFFAWNVAEGTHQHADRLALLPLHDDDPGTASSGRSDGTRPALPGRDVPHRASDDAGHGPRDRGPQRSPLGG